MPAIKLLLVALLGFVQLSFAKVGSIGTISPKYPDYKKLRIASEDTKLFFDELVEMIYSQLDNAGTNIVNKLNYDADSITFKQANYKDVDNKSYELIPSEFNVYVIDKFYKDLKKRQKKVLKRIAIEQKMDIIMYVEFSERPLRKIIAKRIDPASIQLNTRTYYLQSNVVQSGHINFTIKDLFEFPEFNQDSFESKLSQEFLDSYKTALGILNITGSNEDTAYAVKEPTQDKQTESKTNEPQGESDGW